MIRARLHRFLPLVFCTLFLASACLPTPNLFGAPPPAPTSRPATAALPPPTSAPTLTSVPGLTSTPLPLTLWISESLPPILRAEAEAWGIPIAADPDSAALVLDAALQPHSVNAQWIYALVAPFPTVADGVTLDELKQAWGGASAGSLDRLGTAPFAGRPLWMADSTLAAFSALWGAPAPGSVRTAPADELLDAAWNDMPSWAIIPFEEIEPRWKVLTVDGQSPIRKDFKDWDYPLQVTFSLTRFQLADPQPANLPTFELSPTNRDPSKLTTVILTGVTALVRATAYTMNVKGVLYPGEAIRDWMREADIAHISNEIPFYGGCPEPDPGQDALVFCSNPRYIDLLTDLGADVVELTGNHFADYGANAMFETLALYNEKGIPYYGGGADAEDARKPLLLEVNGNKIAFIGCNRPDTGAFPTATDTRPGAAGCDYEYMTARVKSLREQGYLPIVTFQYVETDVPQPFEQQVQDFRLMAEAGAVIVNGSQAHLPQVMEFYEGAFIHYGLGNLFFDQMGLPGAGSPKQREFLDRHVFYNGRYLGVELLTTLLEDFARPRPMIPEERAAFLDFYFTESDWSSALTTYP
ncbi:MAG: CapA family protein [Chloroflexota bacterium]